MRTLLISIILGVISVQTASGIEMLTPPEVWKDYDPDKGAFEEEIVRRWERDGVHGKDFYVSAYVNGEKIRMFCQFAAKKGETKQSAILNMHGWTGSPSIDPELVEHGYAVFSFDYTGQHDQREHYTKYPEAMKHGNSYKQLHTNVPHPDVRATSDYLWDALARRALSCMAAQPEVDKDRMGAVGFSYGGTLIWSLGMDKRLKAVCSFHGVGWNRFHRARVHRFDLKPSDIEPTEEELAYIVGISPEAHAPYIHCPVLFLNGSNDHHGNQDRSYQTLNALPDGTPWATAQQVRGHHDTNDVRHDKTIWMDKWVKGEEIVWPENPKSKITIGPDGVPRFVLTPDSPEEVESVEIYYALKEPYNTCRNWRNTESVEKGGVWTATMQVMDTQTYLYAYANVRYKSTIVLSSNFEAVVPARIGDAIATDKRSSIMYQGADGAGCWASPVIETVGPDGLKGFKPSKNAVWTDQPNDPRWQAPEGSRLRFKVLSKEPTTITIMAEHYSTEVTIRGSDQWQTVDVQAKTLKNNFNQSPLANWNKARTLRFEGKKLTEIILTDVEWRVY